MKTTFAVKTAAWQAHPCNENLQYLNYEIIKDINQTPEIKGRQQFYIYPLRCGVYSLTYEEAPQGSLWQGGLFSRLGDLTTEPATANEPLTEQQREYIKKTVGSSLLKIEDFIKQYRPDINTKALTWFEIYGLIENAKGILKEPLTPIQQIIYEAIIEQNQQGRAFPPEELAEYLAKRNKVMATSTLAVHIQKINEAGYKIISKPRVGYYSPEKFNP